MAAKKPSVPVLWGKNSVPSGVMSAPGQRRLWQYNVKIRIGGEKISPTWA